jgi:hypothetical protein
MQQTVATMGDNESAVAAAALASLFGVLSRSFGQRSEELA